MWALVFVAAAGQCVQPRPASEGQARKTATQGPDWGPGRWDSAAEGRHRDAVECCAQSQHCSAVDQSTVWLAY